MQRRIITMVSSGKENRIATGPIDSQAPPRISGSLNNVIMRFTKMRWQLQLYAIGSFSVASHHDAHRCNKANCQALSNYAF